MEKLWMIRSEIEVEPGDLDLDSGFTKGFINVVAWGDSDQSAKEKLSSYLETFNWKLLGVEESWPVDFTSTYGPEVQDLINRAKNNHDAIILGTFHSYRQI